MPKVFIPKELSSGDILRLWELSHEAEESYCRGRMYEVIARIRDIQGLLESEGVRLCRWGADG